MLVKRYIIILAIIVGGGLNLQAQDGRLENEFKLAIPNDEVNALWQFITSTFEKESFQIEGMNLNGSQSIEIFNDTYFDNQNKVLMYADIGLRYRKRYKDDVLIKELVQLKNALF